MCCRSITLTDAMNALPHTSDALNICCVCDSIVFTHAHTRSRNVWAVNLHGNSIEVPPLSYGVSKSTTAGCSDTCYAIYYNIIIYIICAFAAPPQTHCSAAALGRICTHTAAARMSKPQARAQGVAKMGHKLKLLNVHSRRSAYFVKKYNISLDIIILMGIDNNNYL